MKKHPFVTTLLLTGFCLLPLSSGEAATWEHAAIETDHTFTITFSTSVKENEDLLQSINIFVDDRTIAYTPEINGVTMTLDPNVELKPSESYTVEVALKTGETYKRAFFTKALVPTPVTDFIEKYPKYKDAELLRIMQEQLQDATVDKNTVKKQLQTLEKIIQNTHAFEKNAVKKVESAAQNEFDVVMMSESLIALLATHIETAPSIDVLTALQQTWTNAALLVTAAEQAEEPGLELLTPLEDVNNAIADFLFTTPFPAQGSAAQIVKDLQKSFDAGLAKVKEKNENTITTQITAMDKVVETASDYTLSLNDANYIIAQIETYQQQFKSFENATAVPNATTTYKQFQAAINSISSKVASSTSVTTLETTMATAETAADNAAAKLSDVIDQYLEKELEKLVASLEAVEKEADAKDINYITLDTYFAASDAIDATERNYTYYDEFMTWSDIQQAFKDASAAVKAVQDELRKM